MVIKKDLMQSMRGWVGCRLREEEPPQEQCAEVCSVDVCVTDPNNIEQEAVLLARARRMHPDQADSRVIGAATFRFPVDDPSPLA